MSGQILNDINLKQYSWFNLGGNAKNFFKPKNRNDIINFLSRNKKLNQNIHILGAGSNTLFRDGGFDGTIIKLGSEFSNIKVLSDGNLEVGAACLDKKVANFALENSIKDFEFLSCIPGSIGGTIAMNSGCYENEIANSIISVDFLTLGGELKLLKETKLIFITEEVILEKLLLF